MEAYNFSMDMKSGFNYQLRFGYITEKRRTIKEVKVVNFNFMNDEEAIDLSEKYLGHFGKEVKHKHIYCDVVRCEPFCVIKVKYCDR